MESYTMPNFPESMNTIHLALLRNVTNSPKIRRRLIEASKAMGEVGDKLREEVDFAFLEASMLVSRQHLLIAILNTLLSSLPSPDSSSPRTSTHNLHSELLLHLSPNNNITDSLRHHGLSDHTTSLLVVRLGSPGPSKEIWNKIEHVVRGQLVSLDELDRGEIADWHRVDKVYKLKELDTTLRKRGLDHGEVIEKKRGAIISSLAIKHIT